VSVLEGVLPVDRSRVRLEALAGVTLAALAIPEVMGYSNIAGMPVVTGLYTLVLPLMAFAVFGSSRHLVVGADSATAAVMFAGLGGLAAAGSKQYLALAALLALMTGALMIVARVIGLGFVADFLSRTVLIGFLTGVGIQVAMGQLSGMLGVEAPKGGTLAKFFGTLQEVPDTSLVTLAVTGGVIGTILVLKKFAPKLPGALFAVVGAIVISAAADLVSHGVATLGKVPGGLPSLSVPSGLTWADVGALLPTAASIFLVVLAQSAATSRAYAARYNEDFSEDTDLVGLGLAEFAACFTGAYVVNGSPTKTQMVDGAGGRSQLAQLVAGAIVVVVLLLLTGPLQYMPEAVLSSIVFLIALELIDLAGMRRVLSVRRDEFAIAAVTALVVVVVGVEQGIILAVVLSIIDHLRKSYRPHNSTLVPAEGTQLVPIPFDPDGRTHPGLAVYRFNADLYYANANQFLNDLNAVVLSSHTVPLRWLCVDAGTMFDIDYSGAETVRQANDACRRAAIRVVFAGLLPGARTELERSGIVDEIGADSFFPDVRSTISAFQAEGPTADSGVATDT
jgi:high affinity sulfate transporter 1